MRYITLLPLFFTVHLAFAQVATQTAATKTAQNPSDQSELSDILGEITPSEDSALQERLSKEAKGDRNRYLLQTYRPNYVLPYYYTGSPDFAVYDGMIPDDQTLQNEEVKAQFSVSVPLWEQMLGSGYSLQAAYTQLSYWQLYTDSAWFRETNYEPELFVSTQPHRNWLVNVGVNHQSNGRGGDEERSWNRAYIDVLASDDNWVVGLRVWALIFEAQSADIYNPNIEDYMGHERILLAYKFKDNTFAFTARNLEKPEHAAYELTWSHPLTDYLSIYAQGFSGYGQSLIEYDHFTNSAGIGLAINDWI